MNGGIRDLNGMKSDRSQGGRMHHRIFTAALLSVVFGVLLGATTVSARQIQPYEYATSFDGAGSTVGQMTTHVSSIAIDQGTGNLFVADVTDCSGTGVPAESISKFDAAGQAQWFPAREASSFCVEESPPFDHSGSLGFDNSGHGRGLYYGLGQIWAFDVDGALRSPFPKLIQNEFGQELGLRNLTDVDVGPSGNVWINPGPELIDPITGQKPNYKVDYWRDNGVSV